MVITVLCPSRNNPQAAFEAAVSFVDTVMEESRFIVVIDEDEPQIALYMEMLENVRHGLIVVPRERAGNMNRALNYAAELECERSDVLGFIGDDHRFRTKGWDRVVSKILSDEGGGILYADDLAQREQLPTQVFISSSIVRALGWMGLPGAKHLYLDNTWKYLGDQADCLYFVPDVIIEHMHPAYGKGKWDENHIRVNSSEVYEHDGAVFSHWISTGHAEQDVSKVKEVLGR